jgi:ATP-dependent helicase/nuclease subunit A
VNSPTLADRDARARAASDLDTSFLVEASAGSGKTTLLVARLLAWVRSGRARLPGIVAITFTEKAAAELRLRLREAIEAARPSAPPGERRHLDQALADLELAPIRTIHAFAADLLRQRPVEAGIDPGFRVADPLEAGLTLDETWERWLEQAAAAAPPALQEAVALGVSMAALRRLGEALVAERDLLPGLPAPVSEDAGPLNREVRERIADLHAAVPARARGTGDRLARHLQELAAWVRHTDALGEAEQLTAVLTELPLRSPRGLGNQRAWGVEPLARARAALAELADRVAAARAVRLHNLAATLAAWLAGFVAAYQARLARAGLLDFHDLLLRARDLLRDRPDVRRDFQHQYRALLVDEFQDTDPLQLEIAFFLAEDPRGPAAATWDQVRLEPGRLFLVGDPKQSIYRFRRADIETYERARLVLAAQGEVLTLATNFRSVARLLAAVNDLFAPQMQPPPDGAYQPAYAPVVPPPDAADGEGPLLLDWPADAPPPAGMDARRAREAAALAGLVQRAVGEGTWPVRDRGTGQPRPARFGDVVCLLRTLGGATVYEDAFRAAGVPYRTVGGRHYYGRSEVGWALAALTAIEDPYDPVALVAALRSPFFGAPDGAFLAHVAAGGQLSYLTPLPAGAHPALAEAWRILRDLHARRTRESPTAVVEALYVETEVLATYALDPHGDQRVANLLRILDTARALEATGRSTFRALVRWLRAQDRGGYEESESPTVEEGDDVVRLMTVHAAKGLEFPVVILPDLEWDRGTDSPPLVVDRRPDGPALAVSLGKAAELRVESANLPALAEREARRAAAEQLRLFYVATTRARDHLVLPLLFGLAPRGFAAFCAPLFDQADARRVVVEPAALAPVAEPVPPVPHLMDHASWAAARARVIERGSRTAPAVHPSRPATREPVLAAGPGLSPEPSVTPGPVPAPEPILAPGDALTPEAALTAEPALSPAPDLTPGRALAPEAARSPDPARPRAHAAAAGPGARLGSLVHAALARADLAGGPAAAGAAVAAAAVRLGESGARLAAARRLVAQALAAPPYRRAAAAPRRFRELPVAAVVDGALVEGVADLVFETPAGLAIVEVKLAPADPGAAGQVAAYCRALAAAGHAVAEAWLCLLAPTGVEVVPVPTG